MRYRVEDCLLKLVNVSLSFGDKLILRDINLEIDNIIGLDSTLGQVTTLLGPSGIGKTQLFKMIAGLMRPTSGEILIGTEQKHIQPGVVGMVLQTYPLFKHLTLLENLKLVWPHKDERIQGYLNDFDILEHANKYPSQLSGGQRQRTAIVQQILSSDNFILLDEPFSGLDPKATDKLCHTITKVANTHENNTVIISTHVLEPAIAISDKIWIMGRDKDPDGSYVPGATIKHEVDLAATGMAWDPGIRSDPRFNTLIGDIRHTFNTL